MTASKNPSREKQLRALQNAISSDRYSSYKHAAGGDHVLAQELYIWDRNLANAIQADLAIVEVALRNAMHRELSQKFGERWYETIDLDERSEGQITRAWSEANKAREMVDSAPETPGRLIAQCMFGTWVNLLDSGGYTGKKPRRARADYETLWRDALYKAFPGGRNEAIHSPEPNAAFTRSWVHSIAKKTNVLRNRVAHHEPLHNGFPLPGQRPSRNQRSERLTAEEGMETYMRLVRMIDRDLAAWISNDSRVKELLENRPG